MLKERKMTPIAKTKRLELVSLIELVEEEYPTNYLSWLNDPEVTKYNHWGLFPYTSLTRDQYIQELKKSNKIIVWAGLVEGVHIGNFTLQSINYIYRSAEFAVVIGEKEYWGKGYTTEAARFLFSHAFQKLNLHRIFTGTAATNLGMRKVAKKLGMTNEGVFIDATFLDGKYVDIYEYGILRETWDEWYKAQMLIENFNKNIK